MATVNMRMSYPSYLKELAETKIYKQPISISTYTKIIGGLFKFIFKLVLEGEDVKLGDRVGCVGIRGKKQDIKIDEEGNIKGLAKDWGATNKYWLNNPQAKEKKEYIYHLNEHSNGVRYGFYWYKKQSIITHITYYNMKLSKDNKQAINKAVKDGADYLMIMKKENNGQFKRCIKERKQHQSNPQ